MMQKETLFVCLIATLILIYRHTGDNTHKEPELDKDYIPTEEDLSPFNYPHFGISDKLEGKDWLGLDIADLQIDLQAEYVDMITKRFYNNERFLKDHIDYTCTGILTPTSWGNLAYLALYAPTPYRVEYIKLYHFYVRIHERDSQ